MIQQENPLTARQSGGGAVLLVPSLKLVIVAALARKFSYLGSGSRYRDSFRLCWEARSTAALFNTNGTEPGASFLGKWCIMFSTKD